ncbi:hypothetical protein TIFTF001_014082 [Ficus carica]|uniref:Uncharacterized protein n=1 Tax=Ficus carica TaxID=3494 RepID=A0AA88D7V0_FICCA|nr:hypothetical protein TIFTF001_014082 [Ficus carica]
MSKTSQSKEKNSLPNESGDIENFSSHRKIWLQKLPRDSPSGANSGDGDTPSVTAGTNGASLLPTGQQRRRWNEMWGPRWWPAGFGGGGNH